MTDRPTPDSSQLVPRPDADSASVERFSAPPSAHAVGLTPERAAGIVRQSAGARSVAFLAVGVVVLFVTLYYLYELGFPDVLKGLPFVPGESRMAAQAAAEQVRSVEAGYNIYQANCARCHGAEGQGGIGPILNDQSKLFAHLSADYLRNVFVVGGRYVCGNANSLMPVWADVGSPPGPLNYQQIGNLIDFIRAPKTETYLVRDASTLEPMVDKTTGQELTFTGWRDPAFAPAPDATPVPACWSAGLGGGGGSPAPSASGSASAPPSGAPAATTLEIAAANIAYDKTELSAPAGQPFAINFDNQDDGVPHNVEIKDASGASVFKGEIINGKAQVTYQVPALTAGTYTFVCTVHPNMVGTLTVK